MNLVGAKTANPTCHNTMNAAIANHQYRDLYHGVNCINFITNPLQTLQDVQRGVFVDTVLSQEGRQLELVLIGGVFFGCFGH